VHGTGRLVVVQMSLAAVRGGIFSEYQQRREK
jgi:hypothetical protein